MKKFPELMYVRWEDSVGGEEPLLVADATPNGEDGARVAIYKLREIKIMKVVESLV